MHLDTVYCPTQLSTKITFDLTRNGQRVASDPLRSLSVGTLKMPVQKDYGQSFCRYDRDAPSFRMIRAFHPTDSYCTLWTKDDRQSDWRFRVFPCELDCFHFSKKEHSPSLRFTLQSGTDACWSLKYIDINMNWSQKSPYARYEHYSWYDYYNPFDIANSWRNARHSEFFALCCHFAVRG